MLVQQTHHIAQLSGSTDEAGQLRREVIVGPFDRAQPWKFSSERRMAHLVDPLRFRQPTEAVRTEIEQFDVRRQSARQQIDGRL